MNWAFATTPSTGHTAPKPRRDDPRDAPLEFDLTEQERELAAQATQYIDRRRRHLNRHDDAMAAGRALDQLA